jgi:xanthine dehydrogenase accessory factor
MLNNPHRRFNQLTGEWVLVSPRRASAKMALTPDGKISGSVSSGCVEGAVFDTGVEVLKSNQPRLLHFGVADETAWEVGLAFGGSLDIFVKPLDLELFKSVHAVLDQEQPAVLVTVVKGPDEILGREMLVQEEGEVTGTLGADLDRRV